MSLCIHRPESPAFWTPCRQCPCGEEVKAELDKSAAATEENRP